MKPHPNARPGNQSAAKEEEDRLEARLNIACGRREKSAWVRAAQRCGGLSKWVREKLNEAAAAGRKGRK